MKNDNKKSDKGSCEVFKLVLKHSPIRIFMEENKKSVKNIIKEIEKIKNEKDIKNATKRINKIISTEIGNLQKKINEIKGDSNHYKYFILELEENIKFYTKLNDYIIKADFSDSCDFINQRLYCISKVYSRKNINDMSGADKRMNEKYINKLREYTYKILESLLQEIKKLN